MVPMARCWQPQGRCTQTVVVRASEHGRHAVCAGTPRVGVYYPAITSIVPLGGGRRRHLSAPQEATSGGMDPTTPLGGLMQSFMQYQQANSTPQLDGAAVRVAGLSYVAPGTNDILLQDINLSMPANKMGLLYGRSGAGKTTLLNALAGLTEPSSGTIELMDSGASLTAPSPVRGWTQAERRGAVGMLFQFPERHFLGSTVLQELTVGWPLGAEGYYERQRLASRMETVLQAVGLQGIGYDTRPEDLSGGYKRRLALAVQLVRGPRVLLMDEPLAGLDWQAREGVTQLLAKLKQECTLLVVSHDLKELLPIVDVSWQMQPGGTLKQD